MLRNIVREARFLGRDRGATFWLLLAFALSVVAVSFGVNEVREQRDTIATLIKEDAADRANALQGQEEWGSAAYYAFHFTYAPPSEFAFAAMGQRDSSPWKHRVRMLALEGQIHESDTRNADFGLVGRFDFAFLAASVAPLLLILLLYDLRASERTARRHDLLVATSGSPLQLWLPRALVRVGLLALLLLAPLWIAALLVEGSSTATLFQATAIVIGSLLIWWLVVELASRIDAAPSILLTTLIGIWLAFAIVIPAMSKAMIEASNPVPDGGEILLLQRETVNDAWDLPKEDTMIPFVKKHPELADHAVIDGPWAWKWYYAFQHVGDQKVAPLVEKYREGRMSRDRQAGLVSLLSPTSFVERSFEKLAGTDAASMISYEDAVRGFHAELRAFHYPLMFPEEPYDGELLSGLPSYTPPS